MVASNSYAERARRAQNIRSPIAAPPPHPATIPTPSGDNTSNASNVSTPPSSAAVSTSASATTTDDTSIFSIVLASHASSPMPAPSLFKGQQVQRPTPSTPEKSAAAPVATGSSSPQLAAQALSIVAAHTASSPGTAKPAPTVNVWNQRIERMAAARAAAAAVPAPAGQAQNTSSDSLPAANGKSTDEQPPSCPPGKDAVAQQPAAAGAVVIPNPASTSVSISAPSAPSASASNSGSTSDPVPPPPPASSSETLLPDQQSARELVSTEVWPEVGKSVLALSASTSADSLRPSESTLTGAEEVTDDVQDGNKGTKSNNKSKAKSKWVPIPAAELQAAADAAVAARKPAPTNGPQRKGGRGNSNAQSNSNTTTDGNNSNAGTSANNTPRSQSGRTSAIQSRAQSAQNSPRTAARGRRLPLEEGINGIIPDAGPSTQSRPPAQPPHHAQYQHPSQSQYMPPPHYPTPGHTPTPEPIPTYPHPGHGPSAAYPQHPRHQSHPMQPAVPPSPSAHAFQVSAAPFYPQQGRMPPPSADPTSPSAFPPPGAAYPPPPPGPYGPPMYPMYAPSGYGYSAWPGHGPPQGPGFAYGPPPPPPPAPYVPLEYGDGQASAPASVPPALHVDVASRSGGDAEEKGEIAPSASAIALREKMMFGSIDSSAALLNNQERSSLSINGHTTGGINGLVIENGHVDVVTGKEEREKQSTVEGEVHGNDGSKAAKEGKGKGNKAKNAKERDGGKESSKQAGKAHAASLDDGPAVIPAVQASQSMQAEIKWKFGTASSTPPVQLERVLPPSDAVGQSNFQQGPSEVQAPQPPVEGGLLHGSSTMPAISGAHREADSLSPFVVALDQRGSASFTHMPPPLQSPAPMGVGFAHAGDAPVLQHAETDPDLAVKDYGYGFGAASGSGFVAALAPDEHLAHEREFDGREALLWREESQNGPAVGPGDELLMGIEAGPSHAGYVPAREHGYGRSGHGADGPQPNGRGGRRGGAYGPGPGGREYRGAERGGGYGGRRGRGVNGYSRAYGRGGYSRGGSGGGVSHRTPPFTVTPPQHLIPLSPMNEHHQPMPSTGYYPPPRQMAPYLAPPGVNGFDRYPPPPQLPPVNGGAHVPHVAPPVPVPLSPISFPLDPTRYYLLGQLEYYLSPQNMAQDFFLRKQMDSRGWILISLIASFNRVKQLTMDAQLVRDVLTLSSQVEVNGSMVRMREWERFVLPDAAPSSVEGQPLPQVYQNMGTYPNDLAGEQHPPQTYQQHYQNQHSEQHHAGSYGESNFVAPWPVDQQQGPEAVGVTGPRVNGHSAHADASNTDDDEEEEEEEVVFVMGQDVGRWSPERVS